MTKKFRIWGLVQDRLSPVFASQKREAAYDQQRGLNKETIVEIGKFPAFEEQPPQSDCFPSRTVSGPSVVNGRFKPAIYSFCARF